MNKYTKSLIIILLFGTYFGFVCPKVVKSAPQVSASVDSEKQPVRDKEPEVRESKYRVAITHPLKIFPEGTLEEALTLSKEWRDKVLLKNPEIITVEYLLEKQSSDRYLLFVIYHYKDKEAALRANKLIGTLINKAWPDEGKRAQFFKKLQAYVIQSEKQTFRFDVIN